MGSSSGSAAAVLVCRKFDSFFCSGAFCSRLENTDRHSDGNCFFVLSVFHPHTVAVGKKLASLEHGCNLLRTGAVWLVLECVTVGILIWSHALFWALELVNLGVFCATLLGNRVPRTFTYRTPFFAGKAAVAHCLVFPVVDACTELVSHCTYLSYCKT